MKIALCLSGMPRMFRKGYEYLERNLLPYHDVDIFIHTWESIDDQTFQEIDYLYDPVDIKLTQLFSDDSFTEYEHLAYPGWPAKNVIHMMYSIFKSNELKKERELIHGFKYDAAIRFRFDYALNRKIDFDIEPGKIYVPKDLVRGSIPPNGIICNDQFAIGDSNTMDLYSNTFWNIDRATAAGSPVIGEHLLSVNLQIAGLIHEKMVYIDMDYPFPPGKHNATPHSLLRDDL